MQAILAQSQVHPILFALCLFAAPATDAKEAVMRDPVWAGAGAIQLTCTAPDTMPQLCTDLSEELMAQTGLPVELTDASGEGMFAPGNLMVGASVTAKDEALFGRLNWRNGLPRKGVDPYAGLPVEGASSDPAAFVVALAASLTPESN